jgi:RNA polymerase sigma factor (sigma-70 family)
VASRQGRLDFDALYRSEAAPLLRFFARNTYDIEAARDLVSETFAQAYAGRHRVRRDDPRAWLYGIARHELSHYVRHGIASRKAVARLGIQLPAVSEDDYERVIALAGLREMRAGIAAAFDDMDELHRDALRLRVIDERDYRDVARELGVSEQTARARVSRALRRLAGAAELVSAQEVTR